MHTPVKEPRGLPSRLRTGSRNNCNPQVNSIKATCFCNPGNRSHCGPSWTKEKRHPDNVPQPKSSSILCGVPRGRLWSIAAQHVNRSRVLCGVMKSRIKELNGYNFESQCDMLCTSGNKFPGM